MSLASSLLALSTEARAWEWPSPFEAALYLSGIVFFLLLNAFFVASEFAIVKVRPSQLETIERENPGKAVLFAAGAGFLLGLLCRPRRRHDGD